MSCYRIPDNVCNEIESLLSKFWWGVKNGEQKIHWMSWERMSRSKGGGGMGFRGIKNFNSSLLGKQFWRLMRGYGSLFERFFKGRYYPRCNIFEAGVGYKPSYVWRSICSAKEVVSKGTRWRMGNGENVRIVEDNWIPSIPGFKPFAFNDSLTLNARVSMLIDRDLGRWNEEALKSMFAPSEVVHITSMSLSRRFPEDRLIWNFEKDEEYSVRSAYHLLQRISQGCIVEASLEDSFARENKKFHMEAT